MSDCVFCKIAVGDIESYKLWENDEFMAFLTRWPNTEGFSVVIPKSHEPSYIFEADSRVMNGLMDASKNVAQMIDAAYPDVARCGVIFEGYGVDHLHSKIVPLHGTGGLKEWNEQHDHSMKEYFKTYRGYISSHDAEEKSDETLERVAQKIRGTET